MGIPDFDFEKYKGLEITQAELPNPHFGALMRGRHKNGAPNIRPKIVNDRNSLDAYAVAVVTPDQLGELIYGVGSKDVNAIKEALDKLA